MSVKKLLILGAASVASLATFSALAGSPDHYVAPAAAPSYQGFYVQADAGYAYIPWKKKIDGTKNGFFTFGGALGYQMNRFLAAEFGGFYAGKATIENGTVKNWDLYLAAKLTAPMPAVQNLSVFAKAGMALRHFGTPQADNKIRPLFGLGAQYDINDSWYVGAQWMFIDGTTFIPNNNRFTANVGYKFSV